MTDVIDPFEARRALKGLDVSLSMGYRRDHYEVILEGDEARIGPYIISIDDLREISKGTHIYTLPDLRRIEKFDEEFDLYYKLHPVRPRTSPTLMISGVLMHRIKDVTPREDARLKVSRLRIKPGMRVLDTCMGLGYTAIHAMRRGGIVTTVEISKSVIEIAMKNPRSEDLRNVEIVNADVFEYVQELENNSFDRIIHDPPRMSLAGELYSLEFYRELRRVLKPGGILYHYVGDPGGKYRRKKMRVGVARRLREAGFYNVRRDEKTQGVIAFSP